MTLLRVGLCLFSLFALTVEAGLETDLRRAVQNALAQSYPSDFTPVVGEESPMPFLGLEIFWATVRTIDMKGEGDNKIQVWVPNRQVAEPHHLSLFTDLGTPRASLVQRRITFTLKLDGRDAILNIPFPPGFHLPQDTLGGIFNVCMAGVLTSKKEPRGFIHSDPHSERPRLDD